VVVESQITNPVRERIAFPTGQSPVIIQSTGRLAWSQRSIPSWSITVPLEKKQLPFIAEADVKLHASILFANTVYNVDPAPMLLGSAYIEIMQDQPGRNSFEVSLLTAANPDLRWVVQAVPGTVAGSDGDTIDLSAGSARVSFTTEGKRTLIITLMPAKAFDLDKQSGETFPVAIRLAP
jgi:hypothetical protein